jgi:predicted  nucleic acid-binding Zn-ribbon protein
VIGEVTWWGTGSGDLVSMELFDVDILESERSSGYSRLVLRMSQDDTEELGLLLSKRQTERMVNELENLRMTTAEDKRHMDRQAADIERLTDACNAAIAARDTWKALAERNDVGSGRHQTEIRRLRGELDAADTRIRALTASLEAAQRAREVAAEEEVDDLRATIVRQANEITALKETA